jgi:hypothetical protein
MNCWWIELAGFARARRDCRDKQQRESLERFFLVVLEDVFIGKF